MNQSFLLPEDTLHAVSEGHEEPLPHRKLQLLRVGDDQHVGAGQLRAEVVQVDPAVVRHQTDGNLPVTDREKSADAFAPKQVWRRRRLQVSEASPAQGGQNCLDLLSHELQVSSSLR